MPNAFSFLFLLATSIHGLPAVASHVPTLDGQPTLVGLGIDPNLQRDSCVTTTELVNGRVFWLCRDSIILKNQNLTAEIVDGLFQGGAAGLVASTASWSDQTAAGPDFTTIPPNQGQTQITQNFSLQLTQYGGERIYDANLPYVYFLPDECDGIPDGSSQGNCNDGTRKVLWPDTPAIVTSKGSDGSVTMYHYVRVAHIYNFLGVVDEYPPCSLYKLTYTPSGDNHALPSITVVQEYFFPRYVFNYGDFALTKDSTGEMLYLWGQSYAADVGLARVPVSSVEDLGTYEYFYSNGTGWSKIQPSVNQTEAHAVVPDFGGGTIYWSDYFGLYVWFAQLQNSGGYPDLYMSSATSPEGPWTAKQLIYSFPKGPTFSYSIAAHPEMSSDPTEVYISYTEQVYYPGRNDTVYQLPIYKFSFA